MNSEQQAIGEYAEAERDYFGNLSAVLRRRRWPFGLTFALVVVVGATALLVLPPAYRARAKLLVQTQRPSALFTSDVLGAIDVLGFGATRDVATQAELVKSLDTLERAIKNWNLNIELEDLEKCVDVNTVSQTDVIEVAVERSDPNEAARIANAIAQQYVDDTVASLQSAARAGRTSIKKQVEAARQELERCQAELTDFRTRTGVIELDAETEEMAKRLGELQAELLRARASAEAGRALVAELRREMRAYEKGEAVAVAMVSNPLVQQLRTDLSAAELERISLLETYSEEAPQVKAVEARIERLRQEIQAELQRVRRGEVGSADPRYAELATKLALAQAEAMSESARASAIQTALSQFMVELKELPAQQAELARLIRETTAAEKMYLSLLERYHQYCITEELNIPTARIIEKARPPEDPVRPSPAHAIGTVAVALLLAFGLVLVLERADPTVHAGREVEAALGAPVLCAIPRAEEGGALLLEEAAREGPVAEAFRELQANLRFAEASVPMNTLVVASTLAGEGRTTVVANLGLTMARMGVATVVVDCDLRHPKLHEMLGVTPRGGLAEVVAGQGSAEQLLCETSEPNLRLLAAGAHAAKPAELLGTPQFKQALSALKDRADVVIVDVPAIAEVSDALIVCGQCDAVIFVVELDRVAEEELREAGEKVGRSGATIVGAVLNKVRERR